MTIDEAINHCLEVVKKNEQAKKDGNLWIDTEYEDCCADHRQLAEWLTELKDLREENKVLINECDRLIKEKGELLNKVSGGDVLRICQLEEQFGEAKRLLKAAVEDMNGNNICDEENACNACKYGSCVICSAFEWQYTDEVLKLIKED